MVVQEPDVASDPDRFDAESAPTAGVDVGVGVGVDYATLSAEELERRIDADYAESLDAACEAALVGKRNNFP